MSDYLTSINNSIRTIIVTYMGREIAAEVTGFLKLHNNTVARISVHQSNFRNKNDYLISLETGKTMLPMSENFLIINTKNLALLNKLCKEYYVVQGIIES